MATEIKPGIRPSAAAIKAAAMQVYDYDITEHFNERFVSSAAVALAIAVVSAVGMLIGMS